ncbi:MAG: CPBP family intramembrane metalloprotease [Phycisphaeraceae bacterium]|nr:CPBP family intramembrane metalloprotease [Phycisphaerales bacterium]MCB9861400.1 CPBP family intramembrane metalloprotease [Phycisphaeraceae bacterium]
MSRSPRHNKNEQLEFDDPSIEPDEEEWEDEDWDDDEYESEDDEYESSVPTENYFTSSLAPIHILLFVLPLILIWEVGVGMYLTDPSTGDVLLIRAWKWLQRIFEAFGAVGQRIPAITLITVLIAQLMISEKSRKPRPVVLGGMVVESALWAMPLLIVSTVISALFGTPDRVPQAAQLVQAATDHRSWQQLTVIAVGAGVYEEMLFRMALMPIIHIIVSDLFRVPKRSGTIIAVLVSAVVFALYHDVSDNQTIDIQQFFFLGLAGVWFGIAYIFRGFGIAVGCHVAYDLAIFLIGPQ